MVAIFSIKPVPVFNIKPTAVRCIAAWLTLIVAAICAAGSVQAHPMPDTQIFVARNAQGITFVIRIPMDDVRLALPSGDAQALSPDIAKTGVLSGQDIRILRRYMTEHMALLVNGQMLPLAIHGIEIARDHDADVGDYTQLVVDAQASLTRPVSAALAYDAVIHRIANHRAIVRKEDGTIMGVIRYSLADKKVAPLPLAGLSETAENGAKGASATQTGPSIQKTGSARADGRNSDGWTWPSSWPAPSVIVGVVIVLLISGGYMVAWRKR